MSRSVSDTFKIAVNAPQTGECPILLVTIDHADLTSPIRVSSDGVDTVSRTNTFTACPFRLALPSDSDERPPRAALEVDNVDRAQVQAIRSITGAPTVLMEIVLASDPDTVEASFPDFELKRADYDRLAVSGELSLENFLGEPYPAAKFTPADFPGVF